MVATVANEDFKALYRTIEDDKVESYATMKASIFARYRMVSEMIGIILVREVWSERRSVSV